MSTCVDDLFQLHENFVISSIWKLSDLSALRVRPYFVLVSIHSPLKERFQRWKKMDNTSKLDSQCFEKFMELHDLVIYGNEGDGAAKCINISDLNVVAEPSSECIDKIEELMTTAKELCRPCWDTYFMRLAFFASSRSNCMKRRVGAIVTKENKVVSTGYNGTPRGSVDCNSHGCQRCNDSQVSQVFRNPQLTE